MKRFESLVFNSKEQTERCRKMDKIKIKNLCGQTNRFSSTFQQRSASLVSKQIKRIKEATFCFCPFCVKNPMKGHFPLLTVSIRVTYEYNTSTMSVGVLRANLFSVSSSLFLLLASSSRLCNSAIFSLSDPS